MVIITPEPVAEFLTWNNRVEGKPPGVFGWIAVIFAVVCVVIFLINMIADGVKWLLVHCFSVTEWELDRIDDEVWLERNPMCFRCNREGLFVIAEWTIRSNGRIVESACRNHFLNPDFRHQVKKVVCRNGKMEVEEK